MERSAQDVLSEMRQVSEERLAPLRVIARAKRLTVRELEAVRNVIDDVDALWRIIGDLNRRLFALSAELAPTHALHTLFINNPDTSPELIWNAFVKSETEYLAEAEDTAKREFPPIDPWQ